MSFEQKQRALITEASSGIGKATALAFAKAGINVALVSRSIDKLEAVATAARQTGVEAKAYAIDLACVWEVKEKIQAIAHDFGNIDILVKNAGIAYTGTLSETPLEERAHGIRVTAICPGAVNTELWDTETVHVNFDRTKMLTPEIVAQSILHTVLLAQQAVVDELILMSSAGAL